MRFFRKSRVKEHGPTSNSSPLVDPRDALVQSNAEEPVNSHPIAAEENKYKASCALYLDLPLVDAL